MKMMNPMQMLKGMGNPQQIIQGIMGNSQMMQNPMIRNVMGMAQKGDISGRHLRNGKGHRHDERLIRSNVLP